MGQSIIAALQGDKVALAKMAKYRCQVVETLNEHERAMVLERLLALEP